MSTHILPAGRERKKLGDIAKTQSGGTPSRSNSTYWNGSIPWLKSGELNDSFFISQNTEYITQEGLDRSSAKLFLEGTLLMAMYGATAGKLGILGIEATTNQAVCSIQNIKGLFDNKYIFHFLWVNRNKIIKDSFGGAQPNISKTYIDGIQIPLPPLIIQKEIVAKLDQIFSNLDQTKSEIQKNIDNVDELWKSSLNKVFESVKGEIKKFKDKEYFELIMGQSPRSETYNTSGDGLPFYQGKKEFGEISPTPVQYCSEPIRIAEPGDILLSVRAPVGPTNLANQKCCIGRGLGAIRCKDGKVDFSYLRFFFKKFESEISKMGKGSTFNAITKGDLENLGIPLPSLSKQKEVVVHLDQLLEKTKELKSNYQAQLDNIEEMRKSILDKAFKGELV